MAERRMFSKKITKSARFLRMPPSTQNLYFHLGLEADDDGVVEAFTVMKVTSSTEDDLHILTAKGFIVILNEDLVAYITDWTEHNKIRKDRKVDTIYKDLLVQIVPDKAFAVSTNDKNKQLVDNLRADAGEMRADAGEMSQNVGIGKVRLGKVRLGEVRLGKYSIGQVSKVKEIETIDNDIPLNKNCPHKFYNDNIGMETPFIMENIDYWVEDIGNDLVTEALKRAVLKGAGFKYAESIMRNWEKKNIKTIDDVKAQELMFEKQKKSYGNNKQVRTETMPEWSNKPEPEEIEISEEQKKDFQDRLNKLRGNLND